MTPSTAVARPLPVPAAPLPSHSTVPDLTAQLRQFREQIDVLERANRSLTARNRALIKARHDMTPTLYPVGTFAAGQTLDRALNAARTCEVLGVVPAVRFTRNAQNEIVGIELAAMTERPETIDDGFSMLVALGGMSVVRG